MGKFLEIAKSVESLCDYELHEKDERSLLRQPTRPFQETGAQEALHEAIVERAAILEHDAGLRRPVADQVAQRTYSVYQYRLSDDPDRWITLLCPNCRGIKDAAALARFHHGDRVLEVRPDKAYDAEPH